MTIWTISELRRSLQNRDHRPTSCQTWLADIINGDAHVSVALKDMPRERMIAEFFSAAVAALLGVRVPNSYIAAPQAELAHNFENGSLSKNDGATRLFYASQYLALPSFADDPRRLLPSDMERVANLPTFQQVIVFDLLIANTDRQDRNLLVDGERFVPFDHDQALFGLHWTIESLQAKKFSPNQSTLDLNLMWCGREARAQLINLATQWKQIVLEGQANFAAFSTEIDISPIEQEGLMDFLVSRAGILPTLLESRLKSLPYRGYGS
ncbi:HipA family kinase [Agrobacterium sp. DKPNP3]|uniref:HipA family kinase n=1 Tax=Agrobacterium sp. DKPNP3 TaxID=3457323 RepID=UPI0040440FFE